MKPFKGQTENAGHFLQPAIKAIGHKVIVLPPSLAVFVHKAEREPVLGLSIGLVPGWLRMSRVTKEKADVSEHPEVFDHIGLLVNWPPAEPGRFFI